MKKSDNSFTKLLHEAVIKFTVRSSSVNFVKETEKSGTFLKPLCYLPYSVIQLRVSMPYRSMGESLEMLNAFLICGSHTKRLKCKSIFNTIIPNSFT